MNRSTKILIVMLGMLSMGLAGCTSGPAKAPTSAGMVVFAKGATQHTATVMLTIAAVARMGFLPRSYFVLIAVWLSPVYLAMAYDYYKKRIIHPAYLVGFLTLAIVPLRNGLAGSSAWQSFSSWFIGVFA